MKSVREMLLAKGSDVYSISPEATVFEALQLMSEKEVGALLVIDNGRIDGIISERDYARGVALKGKSSKDAPVKDIMSSRVIYVDPSNSAEECMALMINKKIRHLPVLQDGKLAGIISIGDVVKAVIDEKEILINELENYITGRR